MSINAQKFIDNYLYFLRNKDYGTVKDIDTYFQTLDNKEQGEVLQYRDGIGDNLLMKSIHFGETAAAIWLIKNNISLEQSDNSTKSPLIHAINKGMTNVSLALIEYNCDINYAVSKDNKKIGDNALIYACYKKNIDVVDALLNKGVDTTYHNEFGRNALFFCIDNKELPQSALLRKLLPYMLKEAEAIDITGFSLIDIIVRNGTTEHFDALLEYNLFKSIEFNSLVNSKTDLNNINDDNKREELIKYWTSHKLKNTLERELSYKENSFPKLKI